MRFRPLDSFTLGDNWLDFSLHSQVIILKIFTYQASFLITFTAGNSYSRHLHFIIASPCSTCHCYWWCPSFVGFKGFTGKDDVEDISQWLRACHVTHKATRPTLILPDVGLKGRLCPTVSLRLRKWESDTHSHLVSHSQSYWPMEKGLGPHYHSTMREKNFKQVRVISGSVKPRMQRWCPFKILLWGGVTLVEYLHIAGRALALKWLGSCRRQGNSCNLARGHTVSDHFRIGITFHFQHVGC